MFATVIKHFIMPPFVRVKIVKSEPGPSFVQNGEPFDPFVAVNVKECLMQPGNRIVLPSPIQ